MDVVSRFAGYFAVVGRSIRSSEAVAQSPLGSRFWRGQGAACFRRRVERRLTVDTRVRRRVRHPNGPAALVRVRRLGGAAAQHRGGAEPAVLRPGEAGAQSVPAPRAAREAPEHGLHLVARMRVPPAVRPDAPGTRHLAAPGLRLRRRHMALRRASRPSRERVLTSSSSASWRCRFCSIRAAIIPLSSTCSPSALKSASTWDGA